MAASPYIRTLVGSFYNVYINPQPGESDGKKPTQIFPAGGLTDDGVWVPWRLNPDGTPIFNLPGAGVNHFDDARELITPGAVQDLIDEDVPVATTRALLRVYVATRAVGAFHILSGPAEDLIGSGRTGPAGIGYFEWRNGRQLAAGTNYKVRFLSNANAALQDVEIYVQATDIT